MVALDPPRTCSRCGKASPTSSFRSSRVFGRPRLLCPNCADTPAKGKPCAACADLPHRRTPPACRTCRKPFVPLPELRADTEARGESALARAITKRERLGLAHGSVRGGT